MLQSWGASSARQPAQSKHSLSGSADLEVAWEPSGDQPDGGTLVGVDVTGGGVTGLMNSATSSPSEQGSIAAL